MTSKLTLNQRRSIESHTFSVASAVSILAREKIFSDKSVEWKDDDNPVTRIDKSIERRVIFEFNNPRSLKGHPVAKIIGEEYGVTGKYEDLVVYVDPIDGTLSYMRDELLSSISIFSEFKGEPVAGVVSDFSRSITYSATSQGAWGVTLFKKAPLPISIPALKQPSLLINGKSLEDGLEASGKFSLRRQVGSVALAMAQTAAGIYDAFVMREFLENPVLHDYDVAAGAFIMRQAGMNLYDAHGRPYDFHKPNHGLIAVRPPLEETLLKVLGV